MRWRNRRSLLSKGKRNSGRDHFHAGDNHRDSGQWTAAAAAYAAGLAIEPGAFAIWVQMGHMLKEAGQLDEAGAAYARALSLRPEDTDLHVQLGHFHMLAGNRPKALLHYEQALDPGVRDVNALGALADDARERADWLAAVRWFSQLTEADPANAGAWMQYGHALKETGRLHRADEAYRCALALDERSHDAQLQLGHLYATLQQPDRAAEHYAAAAAAGSTDPHAVNSHKPTAAASALVPDRTVPGVPTMLDVLDSLLSAPDVPGTAAQLPVSFAQRILERVRNADRGGPGAASAAA